MRQLIYVSALALVLSSCSETLGEELAAPELACLDRVGDALGTLSDAPLDSPAQARETIGTMASVMDSVDLTGCSAESRANFRVARDSLSRAQNVMNQYDRSGGSASLQQQMQAAMQTYQNSVLKMKQENDLRRAVFEQNTQ